METETHKCNSSSTVENWKEYTVHILAPNVEILKHTLWLHGWIIQCACTHTYSYTIHGLWWQYGVFLDHIIPYTRMWCYSILIHLAIQYGSSHAPGSISASAPPLSKVKGLAFHRSWVLSLAGSTLSDWASLRKFLEMMMTGEWLLGQKWLN